MSASHRIPCDLGERLFAAMTPYFKCDINCVLEFTGRVDLERITTAFLVALAEEPMWSHRFVLAFWRPYWEPIPRAARPALVQVVSTDNVPAALNSVMNEAVDAAAKFHILRGPTDDTLCFRVDHRLADATAARLLMEAVETHYRAGTPIPADDAPVVRRTVKLFRAVLTEDQRKELMQNFRKEIRAMMNAPITFRLPDVTPDDPAELPVRLDFHDGALDELTTRAMRDRGTPTLAVLAALGLAMWDVAKIAPADPLILAMMVNLRRYLPAELLPAPASMLIGQARFRVTHPDNITMSDMMNQLRERLKEERGPHFGLMRSPVAADIPRIRFFTSLLPFKLIQMAVHRQYRNFKMTPDVCVSDLGEFGKPGDEWGSAVLRNGYSQAGVWNIPSISVCTSTCGSRLTISVGTRPRSFTAKLATALRSHLCDYVGWPQANKPASPLG